MHERYVEVTTPAPGWRNFAGKSERALVRQRARIEARRARRRRMPADAERQLVDIVTEAVARHLSGRGR